MEKKVSEVAVCEAVRGDELGMCQWVGEKERKGKEGEGEGEG